MKISVLCVLVPFLVFGQGADEVLAGMTLEEKVGQLFVAPGCPLHEGDHLADWRGLVERMHIGNVLVKQAGKDGPGRFLNALQGVSERPLLVMADAEWGLSMFVKDALVFPRNMTLGAIKDLKLLEQMGEEIGREIRQAGIHMNLAPVVDVNNNEKNPVIHMRSFGSRMFDVAERGESLIRGMSRSGVLTCAKHFPGHGDTVIDSHFSLPSLPHSMSRLYELELIPFRRAILSGVDAVMSAHILLPEIDEVPATLSYPIMTGLLRDKLGFDGLIITDALNMRALTSNYSTEEIVLGAHAAGADLLLYGSHVFSDVDTLIHDVIPTAYEALLSAYREGKFSLERLDASVLRILRLKEGIHFAKADEVLTVSDEAKLLQESLYEAAVTQVGVDFAPLDPDVAYLSIGGDPSKDLLISAFCPCLCSTWEDRTEIFDYERVVVSLRGIEPRLKNFGLTSNQLEFFQEIADRMPVAFCLFGTPYATRLLPENSTILVGFEEEAQKAVLQILEGEASAIGQLPVEF